jgi:hypothetical protein
MLCKLQLRIIPTFNQGLSFVNLGKEIRNLNQLIVHTIQKKEIAVDWKLYRPRNKF